MNLIALLLLLFAQAVTPAPGNPVVVIETVKGTIEIELFAKDAPKSVERLLTLVRKNFYRGQRFHRVETNFLIQVGDPATRDFTKRARWGSGGSGTPIGVAEIAKTRKHVRGAVGLAHAGSAKNADSQFYIMRGARPSLDGKYAIVGRVISGMSIVDSTALNDMIKRAYVKGEAPQP
ncbi:MAG: peptidylprolyl isomerase [Acidobacteria bacterium]|nr:peptidylprolyl isomerase [Acidobacteriota bacterium]